MPTSVPTQIDPVAAIFPLIIFNREVQFLSYRETITCLSVWISFTRNSSTKRAWVGKSRSDKYVSIRMSTHYKQNFVWFSIENKCFVSTAYDTFLIVCRWNIYVYIPACANKFFFLSNVINWNFGLRDYKKREGKHVLAGFEAVITKPALVEL